jgi:nucleotide-binding universal stress UspA family protein
MTRSDIEVKTVVVPLDGSESSFRSAEYAIKLAKTLKAKIIFMHAVVNPPYVQYHNAGILITTYIEEAKRNAETWYAKVGDMASKNGVQFTAETILDIVSAADAIVNYAESKKADLIIIGTKGTSGIKRLLLGSVASGVVTHSKCPVLVTR